MTNVLTLDGHQSTCLCLSADPTGKLLASAAEDNLIALWETDSFVQINTIGIPNQIRQFSFNYDAQYLAVASDADEILIFDLNNNNSKHPVVCKSKQNTVKWHPNKNILAYAGDDKNK